MKVLLYPNLLKENAFEYTVAAYEVLVSSGISVLLSDEYKSIFQSLNKAEFLPERTAARSSDVIVAVGGDGTILKCSMLAADFGVKMLGINCGRLGFIASLEHNDIDKLAQLAAGKYSVSRRMMIDAEIIRSNGTEFLGTALNDVVISRGSDCKIADFEISIGDTEVSALRADGLIFSTPTGATAYSLSAGGPIIDPDMECIEFTHICPHSLFARTMLFGADKKLTVRFHSTNGADVCVGIDGSDDIKMRENDRLVISKSKKSIDLIDINGRSFYNSVNTKLMRPLKK